MWTHFSCSESEDDEKENSGLFGTSKIEMKQISLCKKVVAYLLEGGWEAISKLPITEKTQETAQDEKDDEPNQFSVDQLTLIPRTKMNLRLNAPNQIKKTMRKVWKMTTQKRR